MYAANNTKKKTCYERIFSSRFSRFIRPSAANLCPFIAWTSCWLEQEPNMASLTGSSRLTQRGQVVAGRSGESDSSSPLFAATLESGAANNNKQQQQQYTPSTCGLLDHHELPRWIQVIDSTPGWVRSYHRPPQASVSACVASVFQWNSETVNIWSHLLAFIGTVYFLYDFVTNQFFFNTK